MAEFLAICFMHLVLATIPTRSQLSFPLPMTIPWSNSIKSNQYSCTGTLVPHNATYIVRYDPMMNTSTVHHMLLYGCKSPYSHHNTWDCKGMGRLCDHGQSPFILFGWGRNASGIQLPQGVGFKIGGSSKVDWFVLQLHYGDLPGNKDQFAGSVNGLTIQLTSHPKQYLAGVYLIAAYPFKSIPPTTNAVNLDLACRYSGNSIVPFAYRVHAHSLGIRITGYVVKNNKEWVELGSRSPQDPQAFYPVINNVTVNSGDYLAARCIYSSVGIGSVTNIGADTSDEMCNFYIMYYTDNNPSAVSFSDCSNPAPADLEFPDQDDYQCPDIVPPLALQRKESKLSVDQQWSLTNIVGSQALPMLGIALGQVTAVQARNGHVYVLHRGVAQWDSQSFNQSNYYMNIATGLIQQSTVLELNSTGHLISKWGENMFYMPHGLTIDSQGNYWITDVAMHQVFKFTPQRKKALELGVAFSPGNDQSHFCKPASVAVDAETGVVFVADGYCNSRVVLFSPTGQYLMEQNAAVNNLGMRVVHKLVIVEKLDQLLVADRENGRVLAYRLYDMGLLWSMKLPDLGNTVYSIDVNNSGVLEMFAIGRDSGNGVTVDQSGAVLDKWSPPFVKFLNPHDVTMDTDGSAVYVTEIGPNRIWRLVRGATNHDMSTAPPGATNETANDDDMRLYTAPSLSSSSSVYVTTSSPTTSYHFSSSILAVNNTTRTSLVHSSSLQSSSTKEVSSIDSRSHFTISSSTSSFPIQGSSSQSYLTTTSSQSQLAITSTSSSLATQATSSQSQFATVTSSQSQFTTVTSSQSQFTTVTSSQSQFTTVTSSQSQLMITSTSSLQAALAASSQSHHSIQISIASSSVVSSSVTSLSLTTSSTSSVSSNASTSPYRSSDDVTTLEVVALLLTGLVVLVSIVAVILTVRYCNYGDSLQPQNLKMKLFPTNGHRGFTKLKTFDPDTDDELTVFTKF